jgi:hypothetical protein
MAKYQAAIITFTVKAPQMPAAASAPVAMREPHIGNSP